MIQPPAQPAWARESEFLDSCTEFRIALDPVCEPTADNCPLSDRRVKNSLFMGLVRTARKPHFAHQSEEQFARFLDFYGVEWHYEPACFPLARDKRGRIRESFTPDFYLPRYDLYVELTTMKQSLVTKKNGKVRRFRALYPEMKFKILYRRDFRKLHLKFRSRA